MRTSFLYFWIALWSLMLSSCTSPEQLEQSQANRDITVQPAVQTSAQVIPSPQLAVDSPTQMAGLKTEASFDPLELYTSVEYWRAVEQSATGFSTESILPLSIFSGKTVSETVALLMPLSPDTIKLYVDYFEGDLVGSKVFYASMDGLLAVDVHEMNIRETEGGRAINSVLTHTFCYHDDRLVYHVQHHDASNLDSEALSSENLSDWSVIHKELQLL